MKSLFAIFSLGFVCLPLVTHAQCPQITNCSNSLQEWCDVSANQDKLWNAVYWWDPAILSHDLPESPVSLSITAVDACNTGDLSFRYELFLDLDQDGTQETVIKSTTPPPAGAVYFGNAANPNFTGGTYRVFDQRNVPPTLKYRFGLEKKGSGATQKATIVWKSNWSIGPGVPVQLPMGQHRVKWYVKDGQQNEQVCELTLLVKDCKAPTMQCQAGLSVNLMPTGMVNLWATDLLVSTSDNTTPNNQIALGLRKAGTGTGFPVNSLGVAESQTVFDCADIGIQTVELWGLDKAGNAGFCTTQISVNDPQNHCVQGTGPLLVCVNNVSFNGLGEIDYLINAPGGMGSPPLSLYLADQNGCLPQNAGNILPLISDFSIQPSKDDNPTNGVSGFDLQLINKHISGELPFTAPWQWLAADANQDGIIDASDVDECTKLILGIYAELPNSASWRFYPQNYVFPAGNPLEPTVPNSVTKAELEAQPPGGVFYFIGVKVCDVNGSSVPNFSGPGNIDERSGTEQLGINVLAAQPNPTASSTWIPITSALESSVVFDVWDLEGRLSYQIKSRVPTGTTLLEIPAEALPHSGLYVWQVKIGDQVFSGKVIRQ
jgi:hypothetical protein